MSYRRPDPRRPGGSGMEDRGAAADPLAATLVVRPAARDDIAVIKDLVTHVLAEFGLQLDCCGTDADLDDLDAHYREGGGDFWVVEDGRGRVVGTCGVWPDPGDPARCELRKMYLLPETRGVGLGRQLLGLALDHARRTSRSRMELETNRTMTAAIGLYRSAGFVEMEATPDASRCDRRFGMDL